MDYSTYVHGIPSSHPEYPHMQQQLLMVDYGTESEIVDATFDETILQNNPVIDGAVYDKDYSEVPEVVWLVVSDDVL